jgi:hypothetical protein
LVGTGAVALWALLVGALLFQTVIVIARAWARSGLELAEPVAERRRGGEAMKRGVEDAMSRREASEEGASAGVVRVEEAET